MDGALGGQPEIAGQPAQEELPDLTGAPVWFVALEADDQALDLAGLGGERTGRRERSVRASRPCSL